MSCRCESRQSARSLHKLNSFYEPGLVNKGQFTLEKEKSIGLCEDGFILVSLGAAWNLFLLLNDQWAYEWAKH